MPLHLFTCSNYITGMVGPQYPNLIRGLGSAITYFTASFKLELAVQNFAVLFYFYAKITYDQDVAGLVAKIAVYRSRKTQIS